jgi:hypothetical protein
MSVAIREGHIVVGKRRGGRVAGHTVAGARLTSNGIEKGEDGGKEIHTVGGLRKEKQKTSANVTVVEHCSN